MINLKCRYYKVCKLADPNSVVCTKDAGGRYCGHWRELTRAERSGKKRKTLQ